MSAECKDRSRLARKVAESVAVVFGLRHQHGSTRNGALLAVLLDQARESQRDCERNLSDHIKEHGCLIRTNLLGQELDHREK